MRAGARVLVLAGVAVLRDDGVLRLAVLLLPVLAVVPREPDDRLRVAQVAVLLLPRVPRVEVPLEVLRVAHDAVPVVLLVREGAQGPVVEVVRGRAVVERERLVARVASDVRESVGGQSAAASRALRAPRGALSARHEEHARGGVKL